LDADDGFGVFQSLTQPGVFTAKLVQIGGGLGEHGLGAAPLWFERLKGARIPLAAPIRQG
jgi:hypothetical protein